MASTRNAEQREGEPCLTGVNHRRMKHCSRVLWEPEYPEHHRGYSECLECAEYRVLGCAGCNVCKSAATLCISLRTGGTVRSAAQRSAAYNVHAYNPNSRQHFAPLCLSEPFKMMPPTAAAAPAVAAPVVAAGRCRALRSDVQLGRLHARHRRAGPQCRDGRTARSKRPEVAVGGGRPSAARLCRTRSTAGRRAWLRS
jgi:hypothetical protein